MSVKKQAMKFLAVRLEEKQVQRLEDVRYAESKRSGKRVSIRALVETALCEFLEKKAA